MMLVIRVGILVGFIGLVGILLVELVGNIAGIVELEGKCEEILNFSCHFSCRGKR